MPLDIHSGRVYDIAMDGILQLEQLKERLEGHIAVIQAELDTINKTIQIWQREIPGASPQMTLPDVQGNITLPAVTGSAVPLDNKTIGLSAMCRRLTADSWVSPTDVRDALLANGYHNTNKGKLLSSVYATLKRLAESGELKVRKDEGRTEYRSSAVAAAA